MSVVVFSFTDFVAAYPQFASLGPTILGNYFAMAGDFVNNTDCSIVPDCPPQAGLRTHVLYLLTAHLATIFGTVNGQAPSGLVGRVSDATQGSVSVGTDLNIASQGAQFFLQSPFGFAAWQALAPYRTALYIAAPKRNFLPAYVGGVYFGGAPVIN